MLNNLIISNCGKYLEEGFFFFLKLLKGFFLVDMS